MPEPAQELAMFPLGGVLFPSVVLPLHVFEPRYRAMTEHLLSGAVEPEFGVVLIARGSEVGGADQRNDVGTLARIAQASPLEDGRWALATFGVQRIRVVEWLPDDPWPRAMVEELPDDDGADDADAESDHVAGHADRWAALQVSVRRVLGLAAELGVASAAATTELAADPALGTFQAAAIIPIGPADEYQVLAAPGVGQRLDLLEVMVADQAELLGGRLRLG